MTLTDDKYNQAAIEFVNFYLGTEYPIDGSIDLPPLVEVVVDMLVRGFKENPSIASQTLGDMSKSFHSNVGFFEKAMAILDKVKGEIHGDDPSKGTGRVKFY